MRKLRILELFAGIGGCATAVEHAAEITCAVDINQHALAVYRANFPNHPTACKAIESLTSQWLAAWQADLWWLSPPCQPFTWQGQRRDGADTRTSPLFALLDRLAGTAPRMIAMENVAGFFESQTRIHLTRILKSAGYAWREFIVCPTDWGWPMRRRRYYLLASRDGHFCEPCLPPARDWRSVWSEWKETTQPIVHSEDELLEPYRSRLHLVRIHENACTVKCFTSAYGRSPLRSGSYLLEDDGRVRHFSPREMLHLMGFPPNFVLPAGMPPRTAWPLIGNSLAVMAVRYILSALPELAAGLVRSTPSRES